MGSCSSRPDDASDAPFVRPGAKSDPRSAVMFKDASSGAGVADTVRNFKSGNHQQSRSSPAIANMLLGGEAGALAAESFKSRASSMSEVAFTAAGVAGEALDDALNAVLRDASPHHLTSGSNKQRKGSNRHNNNGGGAYGAGGGASAAAAAGHHAHGGSRGAAGQRQQHRGSTSSNNRGKQSANDTLPPGATASPRQSESGPACGAAAAAPPKTMSGLSSAISTPLPDVSAHHHHHCHPGGAAQAPPARRSNPGTAQRSPSKVERACTGLGGVGGESRRSRPTVTFEGVSEPSTGPRVMVRERNKSRLGVVSQPGFPPDSNATSPATSDCGNGAAAAAAYKKSHSNHTLGKLPARGTLGAPPPPPPALPMAMQLPAAKGGAAEPGLWVLRRTGNVRHKYILADALGRGQFGSVCIAMERASGERWACKSVSKRRVQGMHDFSMADVLREVEVLYTVGGHPGVVGLREVYEDEEELHLIMELCQGGDWFERLINFGRYTEAEAATTIRSVLEALSYCHSLGVMHRDIKPENIMFVDRSETSAVKLTDFGLAAMFTEGGPPLTEVLGSAYYVAPEVLREAYSKEADVWSTGVVLFIALGGYAPFDGANEREVFAKILHEPLQFKDSSWGHISMDAKDVLSRMLTKDPRQRASIKELLAHPWFQTCAGTLTPGGTPASPQHCGAAAAEGAARQSVALDPGMSQRIPKGSISKAVQQAIKRGKQVKAVPDAVVARLQQFSAMNAFKRQARRVLATYLPEEEVVGLMQVFKDMDKDGDGLLTVRELQQGLAERGVSITDGNAKLMLQRADLDGDGAIDYAEFLAATLHLARLERDERLYRAFRFFDKDGSGFITRDELEAGLQHLGRVNVERILAEVDKDGDGRICYTEFCDMLRHDHDPYISVFAGENPLESHPSWGAWGEATGSGRLLLAMPPDSLAPSRCMSLANSRQPSGNERTSYASLGAVSIRRSLGGNLLFGSRNARASGTGAHHPASRPSQMGGRASLGGGLAARPSLAGSSRFGSMRAAAILAAGGHPGEISGRSSARTAASNDSSPLPPVPIRSGILAQAAAHAAAAVAAAAAAQRLLHHEAMLEVVTELEGSATSSAFGAAARTSPLNLEHVAAQLDSPQGADGSRPNSARRPANARSVTEGGISENHAPLPSPFALSRNANGGKPTQQLPPVAPHTAWGDDAHAPHMPPRPPAAPAHQRSPKDAGATARAATASPNSRAPRHNKPAAAAAAEHPGETAAQLQARKHAAALRLYARGAHQETGAAVSGAPDSPTARGHHGPATPDSPASSLWQQIKAMGGQGCDDDDGPVSLGQMMADKAKADSRERSPAAASPVHPVRASASVIAASETDEGSVARRVQSASVAGPYNTRAKPHAA